MAVGFLLIFELINVNYLTHMATEPASLQLQDDIPSLPLCNTNSSALKANFDSAFIVLGQTVRIEFDSISSLQGLCGGENAVLIVTSPYNMTLLAQAPYASWHGDLEDKMYKSTPYLLTTVQTDEFVHQWVSGRAMMNAIYPVKSQPIMAVHWTNENKPVERDFSFYVLTHEEGEILAAHNNWLSEVTRRNNALWWGIPISIFVFIVLGGLLVRYSYRQRKNQLRRKAYPYY